MVQAYSVYRETENETLPYPLISYRTPSDNFRLFSSRRIPAYTPGTSKGSLRYRANTEGAVVAKIAEICSSCYFAGQNRFDRKVRLKKGSISSST